jgi:hypothetical protein
MKRWLIVATVLGILLLATSAVFAGPTDVGGNCFVAKSTGPAIYKGKGNPQGVPFQPTVTLLLAPTDVGGN